jgi:hypothetical protein
MREPEYDFILRGEKLSSRKLSGSQSANVVAIHDSARTRGLGLSARVSRRKPRVSYVPRAEPVKSVRNCGPRPALCARGSVESPLAVTGTRALDDFVPACRCAGHGVPAWQVEWWHGGDEMSWSQTLHSSYSAAQHFNSPRPLRLEICRFCLTGRDNPFFRLFRLFRIPLRSQSTRLGTAAQSFGLAHEGTNSSLRIKRN